MKTRYYGIEATKAHASGDDDGAMRLLMEGAQYYTNEIMTTLGGIPEPNAPCVIHALETIAKVIRDQCPVEAGAADSMAMMFGARAVTMRRAVHLDD